jgi:hypothetical protein
MRLFPSRISRPIAQTAPNVKSERPDVNELARQVTELQRERAQNPFTYGTQLDFRIEAEDPPTILSGVVILSHKLGKVPNGWLLLDFVSPIVTEAVCRLGWNERTLTLYSKRECSGRILVY